MSSLYNWVNNIKSDDIDAGLAADFDGSLSGLGGELSTSNTYNMRYLCTTRDWGGGVKDSLVTSQLCL